MTFYIKITSFQAANNQKYDEGNTYFLALSVQRVQKLRFRLTGDHKNLFSVDRKAQFLKLTAKENQIEVKLLEEDNYGHFKEVNSALLKKQDLINEHELKLLPKMEPIEHHLLLKQQNENASRMIKEQLYGTLILTIQYDRNKKLIGKMLESTPFIRQLDSLHKQVVIQPVRQKRQHQRQVGPIPNVNQNRQPQPHPILHARSNVGFYLGPCESKNVFSCMDPKMNDQKFTIYEPQYEDLSKQPGIARQKGIIE